MRHVEVVVAEFCCQSYYSLTEQVESIRKQHDIFVLQVPLASVSPWWHRAAGFVVFVMTWMFLIRLRLFATRLT